MDDEFDDEYEHPSYPWSWRSTLVMAGDFASDILRDSARLIENLTMQLAADVNHRIDREQFHQEAARELETLLGEDE